MSKKAKRQKRANLIERTDAKIARAAVAYREAPPVRLLGGISQLADQPPLFAASVATVVAGAVSRRPRLMRAGLRMLAAEATATGIKAAIKHHIERSRPRKALKDGRYRLEPDPDGDKDAGPWNSFPSGHTAGAVAVGRALVREYPGAGPAAGAAVTAVALAQVPKGAHFPSDVAAGGAIGWVAEALVDRAARLIASRVRARLPV